MKFDIIVHPTELAPLRAPGKFVWQAVNAPNPVDLPPEVEQFFVEVLKLLFSGQEIVAIETRPSDAQRHSGLRIRLDEFRKMEDGWYEGEGLAPKHEGLDWLADFFETNYPADLPLPYLFPNEEGGVDAEWTFGGSKMPNYQTPLYEADIEINLESKHGEWHVLNMQTDASEDSILDLNNAQDWHWMLERLYQFQKEAQ